MVVGAPSGAAAQRVTDSRRTQRWTPAAAIIDRAGNPISNTAYTEPGAADDDS